MFSCVVILFYAILALIPSSETLARRLRQSSRQQGKVSPANQARTKIEACRIWLVCCACPRYMNHHTDTEL